MSRKKYWFLNAIWQLAMYLMLLTFRQYESYAFDYSWHYKADEVWMISAITALVSSIAYYVMLEAMNCFQRKQGDGEEYGRIKKGFRAMGIRGYAVHA